MKKTYTTPDLLVHGPVNQMTSASNNSDRQDRIFNAEGELLDTGQGSLDICFFEPGEPECIID